MADDPSCVFCKIVRGELPASIVYESETATAFLDVTPLAEGHILLVPRRHCRRIVDMASEELSRVCSCLPTLGQALMTVTGADAFNVLQNDGSDAGQVVQHIHFHLIPRRAGDGLGYRWNTRAYAPGRDVELADAYRRCLAGGND